MPLLARLFGSVFVLALAQRSEQRNDYEIDADASSAMAADERIHSELCAPWPPATANASRARYARLFSALTTA